MSNQPRTALSLGALCISFAPILFKLIDLGPTMVATLRCGIAGLVLVPVLVFYRKKILPSENKLKFLLYVFVAGLMFACDLFSWHRAILAVGAGMGTILANTQAIYLAVFGVLFARERLDWKIVVSVPLAFFGIYLLLGLNTVDLVAGDHTQKLTGLIYGMCTGVFYSIYILSLKQAEALHRQFPTVLKLGLVSLSTAVFLTAFTTLNYEWQMPKGEDFVWIALLAIGVQLFGWTFIAKGLPYVPVSVAGVLILIQPVGATLWGYLFFTEEINFSQFVGAVITLSAVYLGVTRKVIYRP